MATLDVISLGTYVLTLGGVLAAAIVVVRRGQGGGTQGKWVVFGSLVAGIAWLVLFAPPGLAPMWAYVANAPFVAIALWMVVLRRRETGGGQPPQGR